MRKTLDTTELRKILSEKQGQQYWRSLEELAETKEFEEMLHREFPQGASEWLSSVSRRNFLKLMGASLAFGGLSACSLSEPEKIVPYVEAPEEHYLAGVPLFYATAMTLGGIAMPLLAEGQMGRPIKIEGNPDHPASLGATTAIAQASILDLYDPDRSQTVINAGVINTWSNFLEAFNTRLLIQQKKQGEGLRILTGTITSPALASLINQVLEEYPSARWHQYEPVNRDNVLEGAILAFSEPVNTIYHFDQADIIFALDADFTSTMPGNVRYAHDFSSKRRVRQDHFEMNRLYAVESMPTPTGSLADHRLPIRVSDMEPILRALAKELGLEVSAYELDEDQAKWVAALAHDLLAHLGASMIIPGDHLPPIVHALAHAVNHRLENIGQTITYTEPLEANPENQAASLGNLVNDMNKDSVEVLVILETNPRYNAPADLDFVNALKKVEFRAHLGLHRDETAQLCNWHIPALHYLEMWGDARTYDGSVALIQPLIEPLYDGKSSLDMVAAMLGQGGRSNYDIVHQYWEDQVGADNFESFWQQAIHDGFVKDTTFPAKAVSLGPSFYNTLTPSPATEGLEIIFQPDPSLWDGRFANNGWLQELPKPVTKMTWDNVAAMSLQTAHELHVTNEDVVELTYQGRQVSAPVWIVPGHADRSVTVHLGFGRTQVGQVGNQVGFNAYALRTSDAPNYGGGLQVQKTDQKYALASTQEHFNMEDRGLVRAGTLEHFKEEPDFVHHIVHELPDISLYESWEYTSYAWGMSVDLNACTGCNACVIACQAENNVPVVGKEQVLVGREMHWMRLDGYFEGSPDQPNLYSQPVMCQHCEQAPCEVVCPVAATVHDAEGLNVMVYNRCVGTRYCSNNCPYKVRRFNYLQYEGYQQDTRTLQKNPEVTVRVRGVMEKCTYCIQRISDARIQANNEDRIIQDGEVQTACQAVCPTKAIVFGDTNDPTSEVSQLKQEPLSYGILTQLGTRPRTTYMARLRNPNPALEESVRHDGDSGGH